jgi:type III restriction enzyme
VSEAYEVPEPILNSPFEEPARHWYIREGEPAELRSGRRPALVYPPREERHDRQVPWSLANGTLRPSPEYAPAYEMVLVNLIRERVAAWRAQGCPGVTRTTRELIEWWRREGRDDRHRLFFAQLEAAETIIFLIEARADFRQGIVVPRDEPSPDRQGEGYLGFLRYACKMATGAGKTTVLAMVAAWSILNKVNDRGDGRFSDVVLVVCPNVTIRNRLRELDSAGGEASLYRTRDLVPPHLMPLLTRGRVLVTNWHVFEPQGVQAGGTSARVLKAGVEVRSRETITIGAKTTTARGSRYLTPADYERQKTAGMLTVLQEERDQSGTLTKVTVEAVRYVESDTSLVSRILGRAVGGKRNLLVMNDEAHHAYRIRRTEPEAGERDLYGEVTEAEEFFREATVWMEGLDRIHRLRGINFCLDVSATPYFLGRVGQETNRPLPWVVSDFGLIDAIESGLVKVPQLAVRNNTGAAIPGYFNIWRWILEDKLTPAERGGKRGDPKPEAILKWADTPIRMLASLWEKELAEWQAVGTDPRPPVFILVCKTTRIARVVYEWLAEDRPPAGIPHAHIDAFRNRDGQVNTLRVDSRVVQETDSDLAKSDEVRWMRFTLDTVGKTAWPLDSQGRPLYPEGFEELAEKLGRPLSPPGRDVRCLVSVPMLTEGWDCNTVTHIIGLRPFLSQLLCEQVVGRGLRRRNYDVGPDGKLSEEVAKVFGVPFEVIPFKASPQGPAPPPVQRHHVHALPAKADFEIRFPRVEGYTQAIRNRVSVVWDQAPPLVLEPGRIPPEVEVKALHVNNRGRLSLTGPGRAEEVSLTQFRERHRLQELIFDLASTLTRDYLALGRCEIPAQCPVPSAGDHRPPLRGGKSPGRAAGGQKGLVPGSLLRLAGGTLAPGNPTRPVAGRSTGGAALRGEPRSWFNRRGRFLDQPRGARSPAQPCQLCRGGHGTLGASGRLPSRPASRGRRLRQECRPRFCHPVLAQR